MFCLKNEYHVNVTHDLRQIMVFGSQKQQIGADQCHWLAWNGKRYPKKSSLARFFFRFPCPTK